MLVHAGRLSPFFVIGLALAACGGGNDLDTQAEARGAYLGLDGAIERMIALGFDGYNTATSANIPDQEAPGDEAGTLIVTGQVDQGSSDNKEMRLEVVLEDYSDGPVEGDLRLAYDTQDGQPLEVDISLRDVPNGTLEGTIAGDVLMHGDLDDLVTLDVSLAATIEPDPDNVNAVRRVAGTTHVTGKATSSSGSYTIDVTR